MRILFAIFIFSFAFYCCSEKQVRDASILSEKQMSDIMWDMLRADMYVQDFILKDSTKKKNEESTRLYDEIFRIHRVTADQFKKSLNYYQANPSTFKPILDSLVTKQKETNRPFTPRILDSVSHKPREEIQKQ
jgi:hypothetical protein